MKKLPRQPKIPKGVKYALAVPQSVLFADLSLQGNRRTVFKKVLGIDYEPAYISIDIGGAMSWNYDNDKDFDKVLAGIGGSTIGTIDLFVASMERTAGKLNNVSKNVERAKGTEGLIENLHAYWQAYEEHMASLFIFWNVECLLSGALIAGLKRAGRQDELDNGLARYLKPDKPNYFVTERIALKKIADRFKISPSTTVENAPRALTGALETHRHTYGFLLAPFNLDNSLSMAELLEHAKEIAKEPVRPVGSRDTFSDLAPDLRRLAMLAQRFTFWKTERLDMFTLADARAACLYREAALALSLKPNDMFAMTASEIAKSLEAGKNIVAKDMLMQRQKAYCLILAGGKIGFYEPAAAGNQKTGDNPDSELTGMGASAGVAAGKVRLVYSLEDAKELRQGEIIVTAMTRPEMGAALDRAAAFVTDEGGLLCHAAIIAREMKKPCVIATRNATKLLENGQLIEVNGSHGIVRILSAD